VTNIFRNRAFDGDTVIVELFDKR
jgi:hypothetical protein